MEFKHQMIGSTLLFKYHDPVFNEVGIINYKRNLAILLEKFKVQDIILDVEKTKIIDNNGLSAIMFARRFVSANGNKCVLAMPRPKLLSLLKTARLMDSFEIIQRKDEYQSFLKALVEKADKEKAARDAERARKIEESKNAKTEEPVKQETLELKAPNAENDPKPLPSKKPRKKLPNKKEN
jgi:anti-anti-sigma regulatory factor